MRDSISPKMSTVRVAGVDSTEILAVGDKQDCSNDSICLIKQINLVATYFINLIERVHSIYSVHLMADGVDLFN